jgi:hypothetical protein
MRQQFTFLLKAGDKLKKLSGVAVEAGLTILGELADALSVLHGGPKTGAGTAFGRIRDVGEAYEKRHFETRHDAQRLQLLFEQAVDRLLRPERDDDDAFAAGHHGTGVLGHADETAQEYLEKLFQTTFMVPVPRARRKYVESLLDYHGLDAGVADKVVVLAEPNPRKLKSFVAGLAAGWHVYGTGRGAAELDLFLLVHYLRAYHPDEWRLNCIPFKTLK